MKSNQQKKLAAPNASEPAEQLELARMVGGEAVARPRRIFLVWTQEKGGICPDRGP